MNNFTFYIFDLFEGGIFGTDDEVKAEAYALSEDHFVVNTKTNERYTSSGEKQRVEEI